MPRIALSENALVDFSPERWRLIQADDPAKPQLLLEAMSGAPLRYHEDFGSSRDLPAAGEIPLSDLGQVMLGWSQELACWQLGLTLSPELASGRSSRWFELLRLADPDGSLHEESATQLAQALARTLDLPLLELPQTSESAPEKPPSPLVELPLDLGMWRLQAAGGGELRLLRERGWLLGKRRQIAWYAFLVALYLGVSIGTLTSDLGLPNAGTLIPNPEWLPWLGIVVGVLLLLAIARQIWLIWREPDAIIINRHDKSISAWRGGKLHDTEAGQLRWRVKAGSVQSIYVSERVKWQSHSSLTFWRRDRASIDHAEINLHLLNGSFMPVIIEANRNSNPFFAGHELSAEKEREAEVVPLEPEQASTALQAAAVQIAICLGDLPVWYDRRG